jgi:16S rRNA (cytosine1402-N4)-methyltransferase
MNGAPHIPVLLNEVIDALDPARGERHVDGTFGAGGYSIALLEKGARVIAFDRDPDALYEGGYLEAHYDGRLTLHPQPFSKMDQVLTHISETPVDGVVLDIGVSSMQLDRAERGFSFQSDGPLDMRMEQAGPSAADFLNTADESEIANVIYRLGDEPKSRRIAHAIVDARPLATTADLSRAVKKAIGHKPGEKRDPATKTFQAVRMHINRELGELEDGLAAAERALKPGGRLAVVTFHSLEDRIVKLFLRERSGNIPGGSRHAPQVTATHAPTFEAVPKPVRPTEAEIARNPRARSATLRSARRTSAPSWSLTESPAS